MVKRTLWLKKMKALLKRRSILWLSGVRRVGKTFISKSLNNHEYFDCELPRVRRMLEDPESFFENLRSELIVLDEIHRLSNPSELLKIAADHYKHLKVIATGSSTLSASVKFKDTLTGRKEKLWLTPLLYDELAAFGLKDLKHRMLQGGLPPFFLSDVLDDRDIQEWLDDYWAKDIQELFRIERKNSFQKFTQLILANSGHVFEATKYAAPCEVSRQTISNYLSVLEVTYVAHIVKPFTTYSPTEITSAPKVYGFDTGFICHVRGWNELRQEDLGILWKHIVLNEIQGQMQTRDIKYWRDKQKHEIDFIFLKMRNHNPITIECKWSANKFNPKNLKVFRRKYPKGENFVVATDIDRTFHKQYDGIKVVFVNLPSLIEHLKE